MPASILAYSNNRKGRKALKIVTSSGLNIKIRECKNVIKPHLVLDGQEFNGLKKIKEAMKLIKARRQRQSK